MNEIPKFSDMTDERNSLVTRWMPKVVKAIEMVEITDCGEDSDEHELSIMPATAAIMDLIAEAEASTAKGVGYYSLQDILGDGPRERFARVIWESDENNSTPWADAREILLLAHPTYAAADAILFAIRRMNGSRSYTSTGTTGKKHITRATDEEIDAVLSEAGHSIFVDHTRALRHAFDFSPIDGGQLN